MNRISQFALASAFSLAAATASVADTGHGHSAASAENHGAHGAAQGAKPAQAGHGMIDGEVRKVDKDAGKITIKHGPIPERDMPGMTMVFHVSVPAMLEQVMAGDKVRFQGDKVNGAFTLIKLEVAK